MLKYEKQSIKYIRTLIFQSLNSLDLFAQVPVFKVMKKSQFTTSIGFICTLGIVVMCVFQLGMNLNDLLQRTNPSVVMTDRQQLSSEVLMFQLNQPVTLYKHNFTLGVTVTNSSYSSLKTLDSYFRIKIQNCSKRRRYNETAGMADITQSQFKQLIFSCHDYDIESCNREKHFVTLAQKEYFKQFTLSYIYCIKSEQWDARPPVIQGTAAGDDYQYINIFVAACQNTTESQNCASQELIDKQFQTGYYGAYMGDTLAQMNNANSSFKDIISLQFTSLSITNSKQMHQYFKIQKSSTDIGLISNEEYIETSVTLSSMRETQDNYNNQFLLLHTFGIDFKATEYRRFYQKLQQILGTVGGLWQVLYLIISICIKPLILRLMNLEMASKLFSFDTTTESYQDIISKRINMPEEMQSFGLAHKNIVQQRKNVHSKPLRQSVFNPKIDLDQISKAKLINYLKFKKRNLNLGYKQIFLLFCGCRRKEKQQLDYATSKIMNKLDVSFIVTKLFEIDRLKTVLLTQEQQKLFNYLPKPVIPDVLFDKQKTDKVKQLEEVPQYQYILDEEQSEIMKLTAAYSAYSSLNKSQDISQTDRQLLNLMDQETVQLFQGIEDQLKFDHYDILYEQQQQQTQLQQTNRRMDSVYKIPVMSFKTLKLPE